MLTGSLGVIERWEEDCEDLMNVEHVGDQRRKIIKDE